MGALEKAEAKIQVLEQQLQQHQPESRQERQQESNDFLAGLMSRVDATVASEDREPVVAVYDELQGIIRAVKHMLDSLALARKSDVLEALW